MIALSGTPVIETDRLILRAPQHGDFEAFAAFLTSDRARFAGGPVTRDLAWRAVCHLTGHWVHRGFGMFFFQTKADPTPLGMAGAYFPEGWPEQEIGWSLFSASGEGKGLAFEAATAARAYAFGTLGWTTAVSYIAPGNDRSVALALRLGAVLDPAARMEGDLVYRHARGAA